MGSNHPSAPTKLTPSGRNVGIDLLRIVSMFLVLVLHMLGKGGVLNAVTPLSPQYHIVWFLEIAAYCAVNCYGLISGYTGYGSKFRYSSMIPLYATVLFYALGIRTAFAILRPELIGKADFFRALFPFAYDLYWYFTAYFCLFFFIPYLNRLIETLDKRQATRLVATLVGLFSLLPTLFHKDIFCTKDGYSTLWLAVLYLIGAYFKKYGIGAAGSKWRDLALYFGSVGGTFLLKLAIELISNHLWGSPKNGNILVNYCSPTILLAAVALLLLFSKLSFCSVGARLVAFFAPLSFSVYLIHVEPFVWTYWISGRFAPIAALSPAVLPFALLGCAGAIWLACSLVDFIRASLFKVLHIKERSRQLGTVVSQKWANQ